MTSRNTQAELMCFFLYLKAFDQMMTSAPSYFVVKLCTCSISPAAAAVLRHGEGERAALL